MPDFEDIALSQQLGTWNDGQEMSVDKPYYAMRAHYLDSIKAYSLQVLTHSLGRLTWINVRNEWVSPLKQTA